MLEGERAADLACRIKEMRSFTRLVVCLSVSLKGLGPTSLLLATSSSAGGREGGMMEGGGREGGR